MLQARRDPVRPCPVCSRVRNIIQITSASASVVQHRKMTVSLAQTGCRGVVFRRAYDSRGAAVQHHRTARQSICSSLRAQKTETSNAESKDYIETGGKVSMYSEQ